MSWVYAREGSTMANGPAVVTPMVVDLALVLATINGGMDRDNITAPRFSSSSTWETPLANKVTSDHPSSLTSAFTVVSDGRRYCEDVDIALSDVQDGMLVVYAMSSIRLDHSLAIATPQPVAVAFGVEVDGAVVYHTGFMWCRVIGFGAGVTFPVDLPASCVVGHPVGAGAHSVRCFWDFKLGTPAGGGNFTKVDGCQQLETALIVVEARR